MSPSVTIVIYLLVTIPYCTAQTLFKPPEITEPNTPDTKYIKSQKDTSLICRATGTPPITYKWKHNGKDIERDDPFSVDANTGNLTIKGFTHREQGDYQCLAENRISGLNLVAVSEVVTLLLVTIGSDWPGGEGETIIGTEGGYAALPCSNVPESVPKVRYSWYLDSEGNKQQVAETDRVYVDNNGTLHFIYLKKEDEQMAVSKQYKCGIYNKELSSITLGSPKFLEVKTRQGGISHPQLKPNKEFSTNNVKFLRTQTAELECVFSGNSVPTVTWLDLQKNEIVPGDKYEFGDRSNKRKLRIKNLKENDEGQYYCRGENSRGKVEATVFLDVTSGPIWERGLDYQTLPEGQDARFTCQARPPRRENPLSTPVWFKNGIKLNMQSSDNKIQFSEKSTVLTVLNIKKPTDIMCFQCNVSNDVGFEFDNACLNVIQPIVVDTAPPDYREVEKGEKVDLTVRGTTDPALTLKYRWHFQNKTYDTTKQKHAPPHVVYDDVTKVAYINTSYLTDEEFSNIHGVYDRELYHDYETKTVKIEVRIKGHVTPVPLVQGGFPMWVIALIVALLILIAIIVLIVYCCYRNREKGDYIIYKNELKAVYLNPDKDIEDNKFHDVARIGNEDDVDEEVKKPLKGDLEV